MNIPTRDDLKTLMEKQKEPCVSIFMPTHRTVTGTQTNQIKFKNLLREAEESLNTRLRTSEAREFLEPAQTFLQNNAFWQQASDGLAVFMSHSHQLKGKILEIYVPNSVRSVMFIALDNQLSHQAP